MGRTLDGELPRGLKARHPRLELLVVPPRQLKQVPECVGGWVGRVNGWLSECWGSILEEGGTAALNPIQSVQSNPIHRRGAGGRLTHARTHRSKLLEMEMSMDGEEVCVTCALWYSPVLKKRCRMSFTFVATSWGGGVCKVNLVVSAKPRICKPSIPPSLAAYLPPRSIHHAPHRLTSCSTGRPMHLA